MGLLEGRTYSSAAYNIGANTSGGILSFGQQDVWELKYPNFDIIGRSGALSLASMGAAGYSSGY